MVSLNSYLGIDKRGSSAFNYYRRSLAKSVLGGEEDRNIKAERNLSK